MIGSDHAPWLESQGIGAWKHGTLRRSLCPTIFELDSMMYRVNRTSAIRPLDKSGRLVRRTLRIGRTSLRELQMSGSPVVGQPSREHPGVSRCPSTESNPIVSQL